MTHYETLQAALGRVRDAIQDVDSVLTDVPDAYLNGAADVLADAESRLEFSMKTYRKVITRVEVIHTYYVDVKHLPDEDIHAIEERAAEYVNYDSPEVDDVHAACLTAERGLTDDYDTEV